VPKVRNSVVEVRGRPRGIAPSSSHHRYQAEADRQPGGETVETRRRPDGKRSACPCGESGSYCQMILAA
jgi:hypothetical protein